MKRIIAGFLSLLLCLPVWASFEFDTAGAVDDALEGDLGVGNELAYPITVAVWVKYTNHSIASQVYASLANVDGIRDDSFFCGAAAVDGQFAATSRASSGGSTTDDETLGDPASLDNTWFPLVCYLRGDSDRQIVVNGTTDGNNTGTRALTQTLRYLRFGTGEDGSGATAGLLAEIAIWNSDLSVANRQLYEGGTAASQIDNANLIGYWSLSTSDTTPDDESGNAGPTLSIIEDVTFNADHPTITGAAPDWDTVPALSTNDDATITISYDSNADADNIQCMAVVEGASAPSAAAVEAQTGSRGYATEATTGASDSIVIDLDDEPEHPEYDVYCVLEEGTSNYSSVESVLAIAMDAPSGFQFKEITATLGANSPCALFNAAVDPDIVIGDWVLAWLTVSPGGLSPNSNLTVEADCNFEYFVDGSQQSALNNPVFDKSVNDYHAEDIDFWDNNSPPVCNSNLIFYAIPVDSAMTPDDVDNYVTEQNGDTPTFVVTAGTSPGGITVNNGTGEISGTATTEVETGVFFTVTATDPAEQSCIVDFALYPIISVPAPNYEPLNFNDAFNLHEERFPWQTILSLDAVFICATEEDEQVLDGSQSPVATTEVTASQNFSIKVSSGRTCSVLRRRR